MIIPGSGSAHAYGRGIDVSNAPPQPAIIGTPGTPSGPAGSDTDTATAATAATTAASPTAAASLSKTAHTLMLAERELTAAARLVPALSGVLSMFTNDLKPRVGKVLFAASTSPASATPAAPTISDIVARLRAGNRGR